MKEAISFDQARSRVDADERGKWDVTIPREELRLRDGRLCVPTAEVAGYPDQLTMTAWAGGQFCQRLGIPTGYFRKCPSVLQDMQANYWLREGPCKNGQNGKQNGNGTSNGSCNGHQSPNGYNGNDYHSNGHNGHAVQPAGNKREQWLLRARHGTVRGVLSQLYSPLDNVTLLKRLQAMVEERYRVEWFALEDESLHLRLVDPDRHRQVTPGDDLMAGVHVANSEVGKRAVTVDAMVFRLVCTNGLIALVKGKSLLHQRHIHLNHDRFGEVLGESVSEAFATADSFLARIQGATRQPVPDMEQALEHLCAEWNIAQSTQELMQHSLLRERSNQQHTVYGLANAVTFAAQSLSPDTRYDLEVLAGRLIENGLPRRWTKTRERDDHSRSNRNGAISDSNPANHNRANGLVHATGEQVAGGQAR